MQQVIYVTAIPVREGSVDDAIAAIRANLEASHGEDGVDLMALHRDLDRPDRLVVVEIFRSQEDYQRHMATPHVGAVMAALGPILAGDVDAMRLEAVPVGDPRKGSLAPGPT